jgi:hypothetical protein
MTPAALLEAAAVGDRDAWRQVVEPYSRPLWSVTTRMHLSALARAEPRAWLA